MYKLSILLFCLLLAAPVAAKNSWQSGQLPHFELEFRQGKTMGQDSSFTGFNMLFGKTGWLKGGTVSISWMNKDIERTQGNVYESVKNLVYGGARFKMDYRLRHQTFAEIYAVVGLGSVEYRRIKSTSSSWENGVFAAIQPGVRMYWHATKPLSFGLGGSAFSGSVGNGIDGGPYLDVAVRYNL